MKRKTYKRKREQQNIVERKAQKSSITLKKISGKIKKHIVIFKVVILKCVPPLFFFSLYFCIVTNFGLFVEGLKRDK